jgi:hypothetical protein
MMDAAIIEKNAMLLSEAQRALLAERLLESINPTSESLRSAWVRESDDRLSSYRKGEVSAVDGPQGMADLRERFPR